MTQQEYNLYNRNLEVAYEFNDLDTLGNLYDTLYDEAKSDIKAMPLKDKAKDYYIKIFNVLVF